MACTPLTQTTLGKAHVVTDDEACLKELIQDGGGYPAIAIALSDESVKLRDGSQNQPIQLPFLQVQTGGSFKKLMIQDASGYWYAFEAPDSCTDMKLIVRDGMFSLVPDTLPGIVDSNICEIDACADYEFLLGLREVTLECEGVDTAFYEIVKVPKTLCPTCEPTV